MDRLSLPLFKANLLVMMKHHITQGSRAGRVIDVAHDLCGLHATSSITPYLSLFNRVENFSVGDLNHELYDKKSLLRIRAMRGTLFLVSREMFPVVATATRVSKDTIQSRLLRWHISNAEFRAISKAILSTLAEHAKTLVQIKRDLPPKLSRTMTMSTGSRVLKRTSLDEVLNLMVLEGKIQSQTEPLVWENVKWDGYGLRVFSVIRRVTYSLTRTESHSLG